MRNTWFTPRAIALHVTLALVLPSFAWLGWWQLHRALGGNGLSWAYTFEWPFFGAYAIYMWWRLVHDVARRNPSVNAAPTASRPEGQPADERLEGEVDAYNRYLESLHRGDPRT